MVAEKMCLSISRLSRKLASAVSMRDRFSNTRKSRTRAERPQRISRFNADLAENSCYVLSLANSSFSAAFPSLLAAATVQKRSAIALFGSMYRRDKSPTSTGLEGISYSSRQQNNQRRRNRACPCVTHALGDHETQLPDSSPTPNSFQHQASANQSPSGPQRSPAASSNLPKSVTCPPGPGIRNS